ncbi:hypothetical protein NHX12_022816, partial [Muraenolepis orangiensis]
MKAVIVVHGGAWAIPDEMSEASVEGVKAAARQGYSVLRQGGSALDAVEKAVRSLEDHTAFDAGHGAVLNADGEVELDAIIMDGRSLGSGAVSCVQNIANPVSLARAVMEKTDHVMLTGRGANLFAESIGIHTVPADTLVTEHEKREWEKHKKYNAGVKELFSSQWGHDTVGAVAVDSCGNVACATSTGGIRYKMVGRVGDSPIIGAGGYADNRSGAVSCTGHGESILKVTLARLIIFNIEQGKEMHNAVELSLRYMSERVQGGGGAIAVSPSGHWAATFNTERMAWAAAEQGTLWQLSSFLIDKGVRGSQLKKELSLGGRVDIQDLDEGLWLNPVVVLRRLTVTVGGFRIELLPGPSYDNVGGTDASQVVSFQDSLTSYSGDIADAMMQDDKAAAQNPTTENRMGLGMTEEDVALGLGPYVNPNEVQATNGTPTLDSCSEETKVNNGSVSAQQQPSAKEKDPVKQTQNLPNDKTGSSHKVDCKDKLKFFAKAMLKPKPTLPTVKNKSLVSRRPKSQITEQNPPPTSPSKLPPREDVTHYGKPPKEKKGVVSLKRPGENSHPEHASKVQKVQTGKPSNPKPKSPGPSSAALVRKTSSSDVTADQPDVPRHAPSQSNPKPERTPPSLGSEDGGQEKPKAKKPDKLLQRQKSKTPRSVSVEEPQLFVPDNAPAATKKDSADEQPADEQPTDEQPADEQPAESVWDGTNSCGLCKEHGNMFMVGCGRCDDWFHGDCVGLDLAKVQEMEEGDQMYVCLKCCAEESVKAEPNAQIADNKPPVRHRQAPPQALASGAVRPMKKESDRRQSSEAKESVVIKNIRAHLQHQRNPLLLTKSGE